MSNYQCERPNPLKPSVVKREGYWLTRCYSEDGRYVSDGSTTLQGAFAKALDWASFGAKR